MNDISKLTLSDEEQQLVNNSNWILTKRVIIEKVYHLFGNLSETIGSAVEKEEALPLPVMRSMGKISRGENYRLLPYVLLDHPRCFDTKNIFAVRTMFWWGNFFSMTLQLSGTYKNMYEKKISRSRELLSVNEFYLCIGEDQWEHHFDEGNYQPVKGFTVGEYETLVRENPFIKLAIKFPLEQWNEMPVLLEGSFVKILELLRP